MESERGEIFLIDKNALVLVQVVCALKKRLVGHYISAVTVVEAKYYRGFQGRSLRYSTGPRN